MKKRIKLISALTAALFCIFPLTGCSGGGNDSTTDSTSTKNKYTLTIWGAERDIDMLKKMCNEYAAANPQNEYKFLFGVEGESNSADRVLSDSESGPDIYSFAGDALIKLVSGGALARVGGDIEKTVRAANSPESVAAATLTMDGEDMLYAYPCTGDNCAFLYYDKRVVSEDDIKTLDSLLDAAEAVGSTVHFKLGDDGWYLSSFFFADEELHYTVDYDDRLVERAVDINYDSAAGLAIMKSLRSYIARDGLVAQTDDSKMLSALRSGKAVAAVSGTWNADAFAEAVGKENLGTAKLPEIKVGEDYLPLSGYMGYKLIGVNGFSKNKGEAHRLAAWLTNEKNQLTRFETRGFCPTNITAADTDAVKSDAVIAAVLEQAKFNRTQKSVPQNYWTPMGTLVTPLIKAKSSGAEITDAMLQSYLDALCAQIRK